MVDLSLEIQFSYNYSTKDKIIDENPTDYCDVYISFDRTYYVHCNNPGEIEKLSWYFDPREVIKQLNDNMPFTDYTTRPIIFFYNIFCHKKYLINPISVEPKYDRYFNVFLPHKNFFKSFNSVMTHWFDIMYTGIINNTKLGTKIQYNMSPECVNIFFVSNVDKVIYPWNIIRTDIKFIIFVMGVFDEVSLPTGASCIKIDKAHIYRGCGKYGIIKKKLSIISNVKLTQEQLDILNAEKYKSAGYKEDPWYHFIETMPPDELVQPPDGFTTIKEKVSSREFIVLPASAMRRKYILLYICTRVRDPGSEVIVVTSIDQGFVNIIKFLLDQLSNIYVDPNMKYLKIFRNNYEQTALNTLKHINYFINDCDINFQVLLPFKYTKSVISHEEVLYDMVTRMCTRKKGSMANVYAASFWDKKNKKVYITSNYQVKQTSMQLHYLLRNDHEFFRYKFNLINIASEEKDLINAYWKYLQSGVLKKYSKWQVVDIENEELYHAETNLVYKLYCTNKIIFKENYISISGECCPLCAAFLGSWGLRFYGRKQNITSSFGWKMPKITLPSKVIKDFSDNLDYVYVMLKYAIKEIKSNTNNKYTMDFFPEADILLHKHNQENFKSH